MVQCLTVTFFLTPIVTIWHLLFMKCAMSLPKRGFALATLLRLRPHVGRSLSKQKNLKMGTTCGRVIDCAPPAERELSAICLAADFDSGTARRSVRALDPPDPPVSPWRGEGA